MWRELLRVHGVTDVASVVFRDRYGCWAFLDLWRVGGLFTADDLAFLDDVASLLTDHLRRCAAACFEDVGAGGSRDLGPVMLLLDAGLRVLGQTPQTNDFGRDAQIAVTVEDSSRPDRTAVFARACGLAARETELLHHLTTGADTRTVAARMFLSENTVQDHLKKIFDKTGTRSRRALLSRTA